MGNTEKITVHGAMKAALDLLQDRMEKLKELTEAGEELLPHLLHGNKYIGPFRPPSDLADASNRFRKAVDKAKGQS